MSTDDRRALRAGIGCLLLLALGIVWKLAPSCRTESITGRVMATHAIDATSAVLAWEHDPPRGSVAYWITRLSADGGTQWRARLPGRPVFAHAMKLDGETLFVRYIKDDRLGVAAFQLDGRQRWNVTVGAHRDDGLRHWSIHAGRLLLVTNVSKPTLWSIDVATGTVLWSRPWSPTVRWSVAKRGQHLVVASELRTWSIDPITGTTSETDRRALCPVGIAPVPEPALARCGMRGRDAVVLVQEGDLSKPAWRATRFDEEGKARYSMRFEGAGDVVDPDVDVDESSFSGQLPRFVPFLVINLDAKRYELRVIDLDQGSTSVSMPLRHDVEFVARAGVNWYVGESDRLMVIDGERGTRIEAALPDSLRVNFQDIAGGRVWLVDGAPARLDAPRYTVLDALTLATIHARDMEAPVVHTAAVP